MFGGGVLGLLIDISSFNVINMVDFKSEPMIGYFKIQESCLDHVKVAVRTYMYYFMAYK